MLFNQKQLITNTKKKKKKKKTVIASRLDWPSAHN